MLLCSPFTKFLCYTTMEPIGQFSYIAKQQFNTILCYATIETIGQFVLYVLKISQLFGTKIKYADLCKHCQSFFSWAPVLCFCV